MLAWCRPSWTELIDHRLKLIIIDEALISVFLIVLADSSATLIRISKFVFSTQENDVSTTDLTSWPLVKHTNIRCCCG
jgi:hypothetical protein